MHDLPAWPLAMSPLIVFGLMLVMGALMTAIGLANALKPSMLFVPLVMGVMVKNLEQETVVSGLAFAQHASMIPAIALV